MDRKYKVAREYLLNLINSSPNNTKIPSERDLMEQMGFSRTTVQKAINSLQQEGYLCKIDRRGTFTIERNINRPITSLCGFTQSAKDMGFISENVVLDYQKISANDFIASKMLLDVGSTIHYCQRLRKRDKLPIMVDFSYFADFAVLNIKLKDFQNSVYEYVQKKSNLSISRGDVIIDAEMPEPEIAKLLDISLNEPVLRVEVLTYTHIGRIFEYTISYTNPKHCKLYTQALR